MWERLDFPEVGLPAYLQRDLDAFKEGVQTKSSSFNP